MRRIAVLQREWWWMSSLVSHSGSYSLLTSVSLRHFKPSFTSQLWVIWHKASTQSGMTSSYSSASSHHLSPNDENLQLLYIFLDTYVSCDHPSFRPSFLRAAYTIQATFLLSFLYIKTQVHILFYNLYNLSKAKYLFEIGWTNSGL